MSILRVKKEYRGIIAITISLSLVLAFSATYFTMDHGNREIIGLNNKVLIELYDIHGNLIISLDTHNKITANGKKQILSLIGNQSVDGFGNKKAGAINGMKLVQEADVASDINESIIVEINSISETATITATFGPGDFVGTVNNVHLMFLGGETSYAWNDIDLDSPIEKGENDTLKVTVTIGFE